VGDARATGALRLDVASPDPADREAVRLTFYGDVDPVTADAAIALLTPDAPVGISTGVTALTANPTAVRELEAAHSPSCRCPIRSPASCLMSFPDIRSDACW
jgi:hypothetical protein